jgi:undecaprenyl diphosphate synthase
MSILDQIDQSNIPTHVAVIMDGNGRWAQSQGKERIFGHANGVESVRSTLKAATKAGVKYLTLYAFSTENWNRPKTEVDALMNLLVDTIMSGDIESLPDHCRSELAKGMQATANNTKINLILALSYSARWEILHAVKGIVAAGIDADSITLDTISQHLTTRAFPDPELLIRTSGEQRISNFLLWQIAYAELYFTDTLWPDFREEDFYTALLDYQSRERRFGKTSDQIQNFTLDGDAPDNHRSE